MSIKVENTINEIAYAGGINTAKPINASATASFTGAVNLPGSNFANSVGLFEGKSSTSSTGAAASLTVTGLLGGVYINQSFGAGAATLPLGTTLTSLITGCATGTTFDCWYINSSTGAASTGTATITGATGTTVVGTATVTASKNAILRFFCSGTNTWNIYTDVSA